MARKSGKYSVHWTAPALRDLLDIVRYMQSDCPRAARQLARTVKTRTIRLARFPLSGRAVPEFPGSGLREVICGNYRIIYRLAATHARVEILTVRHGARQLDSDEIP